MNTPRRSGERPAEGGRMTEQTNKATEEIAREQLRLTGMVEQDQKLAMVAINAFVTAFELLRQQVA